MNSQTPRIQALTLCAIALAAFLPACRTSPDPGEEAIAFDLPEDWSGERAADADDLPGIAESGTRWWTTFSEPTLDDAVEGVLVANLDLKAAWHRLAQASAASRAAGASRVPDISLDSSAQRLEIQQLDGNESNLPVRVGETYTLGPALSYELDLFGRIDSALQSTRLEEAATAADVRATALALSGETTEAWLLVVQNQALADLIESQIEVGEQLLSVTENRFATGSGSVLDVLQQKRQLQATRAELPTVQGSAERALHTLNTLRGRAPSDTSLVGETFPATLPDLPPLPQLDVPTALLSLRPDIVAALRRVEAADSDVATAIAARYPRLSLSASYKFDGSELSNLFDRTVSSILANLTLPIIDGGTLRAEVERQRAALEQATLALQQSILVALREVEDALSTERRGLERLRALEEQHRIATDELAQARRRYVGGVDPYLQVLSAVQNLQVLERQLVNSRATVLQGRATLLRALGGAWLDDLQPNL